MVVWFVNCMKGHGMERFFSLIWSTVVKCVHREWGKLQAWLKFCQDMNQTPVKYKLEVLHLQSPFFAGCTVANPWPSGCLLSRSEPNIPIIHDSIPCLILPNYAPLCPEDENNVYPWNVGIYLGTAWCYEPEDHNIQVGQIVIEFPSEIRPKSRHISDTVMYDHG
jgi:hypothetical protein